MGVCDKYKKRAGLFIPNLNALKCLNKAEMLKKMCDGKDVGEKL